MAERGEINNLASSAAAVYSLSHMYPRCAIALALALCALLAAPYANASPDAHQTGADAQVHVDPTGLLVVRELLRWHIARGPLRWFDISNIDPSADIEATVVVTADDGHFLSARAVRRDANLVRIEVDEPRSFARGAFTFDVCWKVDALKSGAIRRDGTAWRLSWSSPLAADALESPRTTFDVPAGREAPVAVVAETGTPDVSALSALHRGPTGDVLELVRPHVARGDAVAWTVRLDAAALSAVADPRVRPVAPPRPTPEPDRVREVSFAAALAALALGFGALVALKGRVFAAACSARALRTRAFAPLPDGVRAAASGLSLAAGVGLQIAGTTTTGSTLVAAAVLLAALRPPEARAKARGPGRWLALRPDEAFARQPLRGHWLDASTRTGQWSLLAAAAFIVGLAFATCHFDARWAWLVGLDSSALMPLFATGLASDLPPDGVAVAASWLQPVFARLRSIASLRVAPWARVVIGGATADELRLLVLPRAAMPGVLGLEIGRAWSATPSGWAAHPEVLVRVLDGSSAASKIAKMFPRVRTLPGRRGDERVVRLRPRTGRRASTIALTEGLVAALTDRRSAEAPRSWDGAPDRRRPGGPSSAQPARPPQPGIGPAVSARMAASKAC